MKEIKENRVALIDDERQIRMMLEEMLEENGIAVDTFDDPYAFLDSLQDETYELILLDFNMPGLSGQEVIDRLIEKNIMCSTPVLIISGFLEDTVDLPPREEGKYLAIEYVKKPAKLPWLLETVYNLSALRYWYLKAKEV